ncbi:DMT family transporter [Streptomyces nigrescens]|uniref:DMT family transporter n=1 Tax=Streptomyces nigrescens TaxID=1920 RepID=UPI00224D37E3|nr:DMT family transporter [Streptomyces libani]MCX5450635.1 DMT family transporter [Streptomyces libani]
MKTNDLTMRPITGCEELDLFSQLPYVLNDDRRRRVTPAPARRHIPAADRPLFHAAATTPKCRRSEARGIALMTLASLVIGASFVASSLLTRFPVWGGQAFRFTAAALLLGAFCGRRWRMVQAWPAGVWLRIVGLAITGMVGYNAAIITAERTAEPAVPGAIVGCAPLAVALLSPLLQAHSPAARRLAAAALVVLGAYAVQGFGRTDGSGLGWSVVALACEVAFTFLAATTLTLTGPLLASACALAVAGMLSCVIAFVVEGTVWLRVPQAPEAAALAWQAVAATAIGFLCWCRGIDQIGTERSALFLGLIPLSAAATAPLAGTGHLNIAQIVGCLMVAGGLILGMSRTPGPSEPAECPRSS